MNPDMSSENAKLHINNFWNYLDELAETNPDEYKKFITTQMKQGLNEISSVKKSYEIKVTPFACIRLKPLEILKDEQTLEKDTIQVQVHEDDIKNQFREVPKILFSFEFQPESFSKKVIQDRKIYLNILSSHEYSPPTDDKGNFLPENQRSDDSKWKYIPTQFRYNGKKNSLSGKRCDFYDMVVHKCIIDGISGNEDLSKSILAYFVRKFSIFLSDKYKLYTDNVKIVEKVKYKSLKSIPGLFMLQSSKTSDTAKSVGGVKSQNFYEENKIIIPNQSENFTNTSSFYNIQKGNNSVLPTKKIKIEDVTKKEKVKLLIPLKKKIISSTQMEIQLNFSSFEGLTSIDNIDLQISNSAISVKLEGTEYLEKEDYDPIDMDFDFEVDPEKCKARYNKLNKILTLVLERIS